MHTMPRLRTVFPEVTAPKSGRTLRHSGVGGCHVLYSLPNDHAKMYEQKVLEKKRHLEDNGRYFIGSWAYVSTQGVHRRRVRPRERERI